MDEFLHANIQMRCYLGFCSYITAVALILSLLENHPQFLQSLEFIHGIYR